MPTPAPKLLDQVRQTLRTQHYAYRTEKAYLYWIKRFILFHHKQHPKTMNSAEIEACLTHLATERHVAPSTQNQALAALLFLYQQVLRQDLDHPIDAVRARSPPPRLPTVMCPSPKSPGSSPRYVNPTNCWPNCCMAPVCACWNAFICGSKTWILSSTRLVLSLSKCHRPQRER